LEDIEILSREKELILELSAIHSINVVSIAFVLKNKSLIARFNH
jgi:hypothetical protein